MLTQRISAPAIDRLQESLYVIRLWGSSYIIYSLSLVSRDCSKANVNVSMKRIAESMWQTYVWHAYGVKQDALSTLLFNFAVLYVIKRVQVNQDGFKFNGTHQLLVYADDIYVWGGNIHTTKQNGSLVVSSK
jgi:hypothetical protein